MRILTVVGNRPQFIKAAAVSMPLRERHEEILVHTGQHHDRTLSEIFFSELPIPTPDHLLGISGGSNTSQTARMMTALEPLMQRIGPTAVLVYGDTNSTLSAALTAANAAVPVIHVEAGMRSFDPTMVEERNRVLTDHLSTLLLCSSESAASNLAAESIDHGVVVVGDVMVDLALARTSARAVQGPADDTSTRDDNARDNRLVADAPRADRREDRALCPRDLDVLRNHDLHPGSYLLLTAHRAANVDSPERLQRLVALIEALPYPTILPLHPRTRARLIAAELIDRLNALDGLRLVEPLPYGEFSILLSHAHAILTDSGGVQKEAYLLEVPCVTLRSTTEWVETVATGWNTLVDLDSTAALAAIDREPPTEHPPLYGDGHAALRCVEAIETLR